MGTPVEGPDKPSIRPSPGGSRRKTTEMCDPTFPGLPHDSSIPPASRGRLSARQLQAAGCVVTGLRGQPLRTGVGGLVAAADEKSHTALVA